MVDEDLELKRLQLRRLRRLAAMAMAGEQKETRSELSPLERLKPYLGERAEEVLEAASSQYPRETEEIVRQLADLAEAGRIKEKIDGGQLYALFRTLGLRVKLDTKVVYLKRGEEKSLSDLIRKGI